MADILALTIPFFGIILLGSLTRLQGWFSAADGRMISRYVFFVVLPPFMFVAITAQPLNNIFNPEFTLRYELVTLTLFIIAFMIGRFILKLKRNEASLFSLNACYPNYGYIGVPLALLAFGEDAAVPMAVILVVNNMVLVFLVALFTQDANESSSGHVFVKTLLSLLKNPLLMSVFVAIAFFALMTIASLTSSISMLEVPVAYAVEHHGLERRRAAMLIGSVITVISLIIVFNFDPLFDLVVTVTTEVSQPLLGFAFCIFAAWIWQRSEILEEIKQGCPEVGSGIFWKVWPFYVKFICPVAILVVYFQ